jgi:SAM-dependent methyltransferase
MSDKDNLYQNYMNRVPHSRSKKLLLWWHKRLLLEYGKYSGGQDLRGLRVLEVGPGHGQFAEVSQSIGLLYEFADISEPVYNEMISKGFVGTLGSIDNNVLHGREFDVIWLSHVLEHSPDWPSARKFLADLATLLAAGGHIVVVGPDYLSWKGNFFDGDATHGYPTTVRNVCQLFHDLNLHVMRTGHHRAGFFNPISRVIPCLFTLLPYRLIDRVISGQRSRTGHGFAYSWMTIFGWRQIFVVASRNHGQSL